MKRLIIIIAVILIVLLSTSFLAVFGMQTVSTDKSAYDPGEPVIMQWSDFGLASCSCRIREVSIYRQEPEGWTNVQHSLYGFDAACVDGKAVMLPMPCDVVSCYFPLPYSNSGEFTWNGKMYVYLGPVESCENMAHGGMTGEPMSSYSLEYAPAGTYMIKYGLAEIMIEIN
ncbi:MAG: hypothetical protein JXC85_06325 [Candidatus Aenigmarchaeota archaeon]|nr:hypothetical protein [Candidatus Aenigmarchaeota archaeon]